MNIFDELESGVQSYARSFPTLFEKAQGSYIYDTSGRAYLDFLSGAGSLNYGHNNAVFKKKLLDYIESDGITHSLDLHTTAKQNFLEALRDVILEPRSVDYVVQFTGPTGTNAVEAALKIARKVTGRYNVISFTNGFHGVTAGAVAATGNAHHRKAAGLRLHALGTTPMPYDGYLGEDVDTTEYLDRVISDTSSGVDKPAAILLETIQGEGGLNVAGFDWLRNIQRVARKHEVLLVVDDIQAGCGRSGSFFSFDEVGIQPDIVTLSKSLSGYGLPLAVVLVKREYDRWKPGEHNGTFRGNNHAFVTATAALDHYWRDECFQSEVRGKSVMLGRRLKEIAEEHPGQVIVKGRGMMQGLGCQSGKIAASISEKAFERGLVIETSGSDSEVVKCLCPLTIDPDDLEQGLNLLADSVRETVGAVAK